MRLSRAIEVDATLSGEDDRAVEITAPQYDQATQIAPVEIMVVLAPPDPCGRLASSFASAVFKATDPGAAVPVPVPSVTGPADCHGHLLLCFTS